MKILAVADVEDNLLYNHFRKDRTAGVELIVACGDLRADYMDYLMTMVNVPMIYVRGNHDDDLIKTPPLGAVCIEDRIYKYKGYRFMGLGGCMRYKARATNMFTEKEMTSRVIKLTPKAILSGGIDVLVTHAPAKGYGDLSDLPHMGYDIFNKVMTRYKPSYMLHGHVHTNYGRVKTEYEHPSGTRIVNACGFKIIDLPDPRS